VLVTYFYENRWKKFGCWKLRAHFNSRIREIWKLGTCKITFLSKAKGMGERWGIVKGQRRSKVYATFLLASHVLPHWDRLYLSSPRDIPLWTSSHLQAHQAICYSRRVFNTTSFPSISRLRSPQIYRATGAFKSVSYRLMKFLTIY